MRVLIIENATSAPAGLFGQWLTAQGAALTTVTPETMPADHAGYDLTVTLGSPAGAWEDLGWVQAQKQFLAAALADQHPVVGICFGAQILAEVIGGKAAPMGERHAGWIDITEAADPVFAGPWPRWHGDHLTVPETATVLARSRGTVQAFAHGSAIAVQFHPEADQAILDLWASKTPDWVAENNTTREALSAQSAALIPAREAARDALFRRLIAHATGFQQQEQAA